MPSMGVLTPPNFSNTYNNVATRAATSSAQNALARQNMSPDDQANLNMRNALGSAGLPTGAGDIHNARIALINGLAAGMSGGGGGGGSNTGGGARRIGSSSGGGGSFRLSGGGGGGGGTPAPTLGQGQVDWLTQLLRSGMPTPITANTLDLPDYTGMAVRAFDPSMYRQALAALNQGVNLDLATANRSQGDMLNFLRTNYRNAFNNPNLQYAQMGQAPGMDQQAMGRMLQAQGVDPSVASATQMQGSEADQAFGNLWRTLGANEQLMQGNRLANARQYGNQARDAIQAAALGGRLGINLNQAQAQAAWQQRADERAYQDYQMQQQIAQQEALQNWQRANTVQDTNYDVLNQYRNSEIQALLGLLPEFIKNSKLNLPSPSALGWV